MPEDLDDPRDGIRRINPTYNPDRENADSGFWEEQFICSVCVDEIEFGREATLAQLVAAHAHMVGHAQRRGWTSSCLDPDFD